MSRRTRQRDPDLDIHVHPSMEDDFRYNNNNNNDDDEDDDDAAMARVDGGDNSSHHGNEDDVFSDHSPRSSMGSVSEGAPRKSPHDGLRSPRISDIQQYDDDANYAPAPAPAAKAAPAPRPPPFRSPSSAKALPTSSPAQSVVGSGQPRSGRRSALPTASRLGSPNLSAQYSPKKTPPRFKKSDPPLVLLHVTLLPLRWSWGDVLDDAKTSELSDGVKALREAWRQLQDTIGDTIQDRGVLLPHPQNDFEVMEERLLEALELPFKRRARILECGHYLGPSSEMPFADEHDSEDDDDDDDAASEDDGSTAHAHAHAHAGAGKRQTHWCSTCHCEIRFDALGAGKMYRVKVYASNGLLRAGAWEACWKEMERVDIELEPMMDAKLQDELVRLAARQDRVIHSKSRAGRRPLSSRVQDVEDEREDDHLDDPAVGEETMHEHLRTGPEPFMPHAENAHRRDASYDTTSSERYRDVYGGQSRQHSARTSTSSRPSMGFAGRDDSFGQRKQPVRFHAGSFPEAVANALRALLDDKRNLAILLLSALTLAVALRGGGVVSRGFYDDVVSFRPVLTDSETPTAVVPDGIGPGGEVEGEEEAGGEAERLSSPTPTVVDILFTPPAKMDAENPCAAMEPQTVEKWMTATVTEMTTVTRTEMPYADSELFSDGGQESLGDVAALAGDTLTLGENFDHVADEGFEGGGGGGGGGQSDWEWGARFRFPW
ncbi:pathway-specific nitrogen regulator [Trichoderma cornu-damae]|uniref:Pathway-specific nitrogen regulator n=1 Tax=Trichoderma cornu-damae TaxID=654480 RepID=A0A9P8TX78_9HYPO|nr:pathway-specific nitrogen regulator [Trichoderma cornu-damae]